VDVMSINFPNAGPNWPLRGLSTCITAITYRCYFAYMAMLVHIYICYTITMGRIFIVDHHVVIVGRWSIIGITI